VTYHFVIAVWSKNAISGTRSIRKSLLTISAKQAGAGGCVSAVTSEGRIIWVADAHRGDGNRFVVHADEKLTAFVELDAAIRASVSVSGI